MKGAPISIRCPSCSAEVRVLGGYRKAKCKACGHVWEWLTAALRVTLAGGAR